MARIGPMTRLLVAVLGFGVGGAGGFVLGLVMGFGAAQIFRISCFEGACGFFAVFLFALPGLLIGAGVGLWLALLATRDAGAGGGT